MSLQATTDRWLTRQTFISRSSGGWHSETRVPVRSGPPPAVSSQGLPSVSVLPPRQRALLSLPSQDHTPMTSSNPNYPPKAMPPYTVLLGVKGFNMGVWGHTNIQPTTPPTEIMIYFFPSWSTLQRQCYPLSSPPGLFFPEWVLSVDPTPGSLWFHSFTAAPKEAPGVPQSLPLVPALACSGPRAVCHRPRRWHQLSATPFSQHALSQPRTPGTQAWSSASHHFKGH